MESVIHVGILGPLFFAVAALYAVAGLGGASTYLALLVVAGAQINEIAPVALCCNIVVTAGSSFQFGRRNLIPLGLIVPFIFFSVPAAFLGGTMRVSEPFLKVMLGVCLFSAGIYLLNFKRFSQSKAILTPSAKQLWPTALIIGGSVGLISGMVGIGGGIFLAPTLYLLRWIDARQIAAASSLFILVNSTAAVFGHAVSVPILPTLVASLPLVTAVFLGGLAGSYFSSSRLKPDTVRLITAMIVLFASLRIVWAAIV